MTLATERWRLLERDREAREVAQQQFETPVLIEAGAGTGKTTTLVARVLAWLLGPGWTRARDELAQDRSDRIEPDQIAPLVLEGVVSITFTEAAAAEMEARIAKALALVAGGRAEEIVGFHPPALEVEEAPTLEGRGQALLAALDHLTVRTIHAYCLNLLKRYPLEAGLHPELTVDADGAVLEELVSEVVEAGLRSAYSREGDGPLIQLARRQIGPRRIAETLRTLVERGFSSEHLEADPFDSDRLTALVRRLSGPLENLRDAIDDRFDHFPARQNAPKIAAAVEATREQLAAIADASVSGVERAAALCDLVSLLWPTSLAKDHLGKWKRSSFGKAEAAALGDDAARLAAAAGDLRETLRQLRRLRPRLLDAGRRALVALLAEVEREMQARGVITFNGLLQATRDLLASDRAVRRRERRRLRQLLVDEFQDTDRIQCDLVRLLALSGRPERRPGLFVVGDPKQSIYGWRNADLEAYEEFVASAIEAGGDRFPLVENFRSAAPILHEVDRAVGPTMIRESGLQPGYEPLIPCEDLAAAEGFAGASRGPIEMWVSWLPADEDRPGEAATPFDEAAQLEAEAVARDIADLHQRGEAGWSDFALLLRSGSRLDTFLSAFRDAGVPFAVARDKSYYRRREIIEAAALVRAIVNPVDHLALLSFLRSPTVGVPDAALVPLWVRQLPDLMSELTETSKETRQQLRKLIASAAAEVPDTIPGIGEIRGWEKSLEAGIDMLLRLRVSFRTEPPDRFIERIRTWLLLEATESARYLGAYRVANVERFLRELESSLDRTGGDIQSVLRSLRRSVREAREAEEAVPKEAALDAVQVLTIHAAKGLEFQHVYLAQLHAEPPDNDDRDVDTDERWSPGQPLEYRIFGCPTPDFDRVGERRRRIEAAERVRLLYVAMTRARERLVLIGRWPEQPEPVAIDRRRSFVDLLRSRETLPESLSQLVPSAGDRERGIDHACALWFFPGFQEIGAVRRPGAEPPAWLPPAESVRSSAEHLRELRANALARMNRSFHAPASREAGERLEAQALESATRNGRSSGSREVALQVGTAIHQMFELWDLDNDPDAELALRRRALDARLQAELAKDLHGEGLERAHRLVERIGEGELLQRFLGLRSQIVARELPVVLPAGVNGTGPVGFTTGAIDLLYRSDDGQLVIVDFKTDTLELDLEIEARAADYASQERAYQEALRSALALDRPPRCELWFLWPDRLHVG